MRNDTKDRPEILNTETLYSGRVLDLTRVELKMPDGAVVRREIVEHHGSVGILPITADGRILMVRQYRAPAREWLLELPAGTLEPGEDPAVCALRELSEEVGFTASSLQKLAGFYLAPGWATEFMHAYLAVGLTPQTAQGDDDEDIEVETLTAEEALDAIRTGKIVDCKSIAILGLYFTQGLAARSAPVQPDPWLHDNPDEISG